MKEPDTLTKITNLNLPALLKTPGRYRVGDGMFLKVLDERRAYYVYRYRVDGHEREASLGLGAQDDARGRQQSPLDHAQGSEGRQDRPTGPEARRQGRHRDAERETDVRRMRRPVPRPAGSARLAGKKNPVHRQQWRSTLASLPASFRDLPVDEIGPKQVFDALDPIWAKTPETASRLRGRIAAVLDFAREPEDARPNPAAWSGWLKNCPGSAKALGKIDPKTGERVARGHYAALAYVEIQVHSPACAPLAT